VWGRAEDWERGTGRCFADLFLKMDSYFFTTETQPGPTPFVFHRLLTGQNFLSRRSCSTLFTKIRSHKITGARSLLLTERIALCLPPLAFLNPPCYGCCGRCWRQD